MRPGSHQHSVARTGGVSQRDSEGAAGARGGNQKAWSEVFQEESDHQCQMLTKQEMKNKQKLIDTDNNMVVTRKKEVGKEG